MTQTAEAHPIFQNILNAIMPRKAGPTAADLELLNDAHQSLVRLGRIEDCADPRAYIRATNVVLDHCVRCGMDPCEADHEGWAALRIGRWLMEA